MRIIEETQLDFDNVLIQPKCSKILSRSQVNLEREFKWYDTDNKIKYTMKCIPYGTTNMGTVGTCKMAKLMALNNHIACLEKHISYEEIDKLFSELTEEQRDKIIPSIGIKETTDNIKKLYDKWHIKMLMIDVPNGYIPSLINRIRELHSYCIDTCIIAGNVVDAAGASQLLDAGAKIIKIGIGNGCFLGNNKIITDNGLKKIQDIDIGDRVLTHNGTFSNVINKFTFNTHKKIIDINGIKCTPNHKFYVANIKDIEKITEKNYRDYCFWVAAENLDPLSHKLIKLS